MQSKTKLGKLIAVASIAVALCLGVLACGWGPTGPGAKADITVGPGIDLSALNVFYAYGFSDIYFTPDGVCYRYGDCYPYPNPSTAADMFAALGDESSESRGGVTANASGPTKDHAWGGDVYQTDQGQKTPVWCMPDRSFVILSASGNGDPNYLTVQWISGPLRGTIGYMHKLVYMQSSFCGFTLLGAMSFPVKGGVD